MRESRTWIRVGALLGLLGVALGAFGAHGLPAETSSEALEWWRTGAQYHLLHAVAVVVLGLCMRAGGSPLPPLLLSLGVLVFSGTLYAMALGAPRWLGAITPLGGVLLMAGWLALLLRAPRSTAPP